MKRNIIAAAMVCIALMAGCEKPQEEPEKPGNTPLEPETPVTPEKPDEGEATYKMTDVELTGEIEALTKTTFSDGKVTWKSGDKISVFYTADSKTEVSEFTSAGEGASATFKGRMSLLIDPKKPAEVPAVEKWAVYPAATASAFDGTAFTVTVPETQTAQEGSFAAETCWPLVAKSGDNSLKFSAVCGGVAVTFQRAGITFFTFKAANGEKIAGKASVALDATGKPAAAPAEQSVSEIKVNAPAAGFEVGKTYYVTALPANLAGGYTITLSDAGTVACETAVEISRDAFTAVTVEEKPQEDSNVKLKTALKPLSWWESEIKVNAPAAGFEVGKTYYVTALPANLAGGYTITLSDAGTVACETAVEISRDAFTAVTVEEKPQEDSNVKLKTALKPLSWWESEMAYLPAPSPAYTATDKEYDRTQWKRNLSCIRLTSDLDYIYGYIESKGDEDLSMLKNLGIWLDTDGDQSATQGGGWLFTLYKFLDVSVYGEVGENLVWTPGLHSQTSADGEKYGAEVTTSSPAGYGEGSFSASVFKYTFVIDRKVVGLADATKTVVGVNFDNGKGIVGANLTNPDRGGYRLNLKNADSPAFDETAIYRKLRGVNDWANVDYTPITNPGNNRGNTKIKFDSDADYVYGYIEVPNTDNLYFKNGEYYEFCPGFISKLAIGLDLDGVESGQGIGWPVGTCWETVLNGRILSCKRPLSDEDKALGWKDRWGHYIFPSDSFDPETKTRPAYTITPETWSPSITEGKDGGFGDVKAGTSDWQNFATGKGEWKDKTFRYSFIIERERLGLKGLTQLKLGIFMYEDGVSGYSNTPDAVGSTIKLNN